MFSYKIKETAPAFQAERACAADDWEAERYAYLSKADRAQTATQRSKKTVYRQHAQSYDCSAGGGTAFADGRGVGGHDDGQLRGRGRGGGRRPRYHDLHDLHLSVYRHFRGRLRGGGPVYRQQRPGKGQSGSLPDFSFGRAGVPRLHGADASVRLSPAGDHVSPYGSGDHGRLQNLHVDRRPVLPGQRGL